MYKVICEKDGDLFCVFDYWRNDYNEPSYINFCKDLTKALSMCGVIADKVEDILGENGYNSYRIKVPDTEPLYSVRDLQGCDLLEWTKRSPATLEYLLGHFYALTLDNEEFYEECGGTLNWERDFINARTREEVIENIEDFFGVELRQADESHNSQNCGEGEKI